MALNIPKDAKTGLVDEDPNKTKGTGGTGSDGAARTDHDGSGGAASGGVGGDGGAGAAAGAAAATSPEPGSIEEILAKPQEEWSEEESTRIIQHNIDRYTELSAKPKEQRSDEETQFVQAYEQSLKETSTIYNMTSRYGVEGEYEESIDGLYKVTDKIREQAAQAGIQNFLNENPLLNKLYQHLKEKKGIDSFMQRATMKDYSKIELAAGDEDGHEAVYRELLTKSNIDPDEIEELVTTAKANNKLEEKGKGALKKLVAIQEAEVAAKEKREQEAKITADNEAKETERQIKEIINSGKVAGVTIPVTEVNELIDYIITPVGLHPETGEPMSKADIAYFQLPIEKRILVDILIKKDFKGIGSSSSKSTVNINSILKGQESKTKKVDMTGGSGGGPDIQRPGAGRGINPADLISRKIAGQFQS